MHNRNAIPLTNNQQYFMTSERLGFRHWMPADLPLAIELWGDEKVTGRFLRGPWAPKQCERQLGIEMTNQEEWGFQLWPIFELSTGRHAGCAGLRPFHDESDVFEVGAMLARTFMGARYGEEAVRAVIEYAFETRGARAIVSKHHPDHPASKSLVDRLGFQFTHLEPLWDEGSFASLPMRLLNAMKKQFRHTDQKRQQVEHGPCYRLDRMNHLNRTEGSAFD